MRIECSSCHVSTPQLVYYHEPAPYDWERRWMDLGMVLEMRRVREELRRIWNRRPEDEENADECQGEG